MTQQEVEALGQSMLKEHGLSDWTVYAVYEDLEEGDADDIAGSYGRALLEEKVILVNMRYAADPTLVHEILLHEIAHALVSPQALLLGYWEDDPHGEEFQAKLLEIGGAWKMNSEPSSDVTVQMEEAMKHERMEVVSWREARKGESLQGFFSIALPSGLRLIDLAYHERKDGARWVSTPAKSYQKDDGSVSWVPMMEFTSKSVRESFTTQALQALDIYLKNRKPSLNEDEESPF